MSHDEKQDKATPYRFLARQVNSALANRWAVWILTFIAFAWAIIASQLLFPFYSNNHDEAIYLLQAQALAQGKLFLPVHPLNEFFNVHFVVHQGDKVIFKYTPVHAAFLALGLLLCGSARATLGFVAAGNVLLIYLFSRELYLPKQLSFTAAIFFLFSPLFLIQSATFLSYTTAFLLYMSFAVLLLRGQRLQKSHLLIGAGLALGLAFFARPYDAILFTIPLGVLFFGRNRKQINQFLSRVGWVLVGFSPIFGLVLTYNYYTTGDCLRFPFWLWDAQDNLGFGWREHGTILYDLTAAITSLQNNLIQLNGWIFGGSILLGLVLLQIVTHPITWSELALLLLLFVFPGGYFFFWGGYHAVILGVIEYLGPYYYFPILVPLVILGAQGLFYLSRREAMMGRVLVALMLLINGGLLLRHIVQNYAYTRENQAIYRPFIEQKFDKALIFVPTFSRPFLLAPLAYLINTPTLDGPLLYAINRNNQNFTLLDAYPERSPYRFDYYGPYTEKPDDNPHTALVKLERGQVDLFTERLQITNPTNSPYLFIEVLNNGQAETYLLDDSSMPGKQYIVEWRISPQNIEFKGDYRQHLSSITNLSPADKLVISVAFTDTPTRQTQRIFERRYDFCLTGDNQLDMLLPAEEWTNAHWPVAEWLMGDIDEVMTDK